MRKLKMRKKTLSETFTANVTGVIKGLQVSSGNGFYSAQNNKERPSH